MVRDARIRDPLARVEAQHGHVVGNVDTAESVTGLLPGVHGLLVGGDVNPASKPFTVRLKTAFTPDNWTSVRTGSESSILNSSRAPMKVSTASWMSDEGWSHSVSTVVSSFS